MDYFYQYLTLGHATAASNISSISQYGPQAGVSKKHGKKTTHLTLTYLSLESRIVVGGRCGDVPSCCPLRRLTTCAYDGTVTPPISAPPSRGSMSISAGRGIPKSKGSVGCSVSVSINGSYSSSSGVGTFRDGNGLGLRPFGGMAGFNESGSSSVNFGLSGRGWTVLVAGLRGYKMGDCPRCLWSLEGKGAILGLSVGLTTWWWGVDGRSVVLSPKLLRFGRGGSSSLSSSSLMSLSSLILCFLPRHPSTTSSTSSSNTFSPLYWNLIFVSTAAKGESRYSSMCLRTWVPSLLTANLSRLACLGVDDEDESASSVSAPVPSASESSRMPLLL